MPQSRDFPIIRQADLHGTDAPKVSRLVDAYLRETEREKAFHLEGRPVGNSPELTAAYLAEIDPPRAEYAEAVVCLAEIGSVAAGVVVLRPTADGTELTRLWADPAFRGHRMPSRDPRPALVCMAHGNWPTRQRQASVPKVRKASPGGGALRGPALLRSTR